MQGAPGGLPQKRRWIQAGKKTPAILECILRAAPVNEKIATGFWDIQSNEARPKQIDDYKINLPGKAKSIFKKGTRPIMDDVLNEA